MKRGGAFPLHHISNFSHGKIVFDTISYREKTGINYKRFHTITGMI